MPRKKRTIVEETIPDEVPNNNDNDNDISDIVITLSKVYRVNPNGKRAFSFQSADPVDEVMIQDRVPTGGSFIVIEYNSMGETVNTVNHEIEPKTTPALNNPAASSSDIQVQMLMSELQWARGMVMTLMGNRNNEQTPISEIVSAIKNMQSIAGGNAKDPVDMIIKGMELANKANGGTGDWKTELISTAKEAIGPVLSALNASRQPQPQTGDVQMIPANTQPIPPTPENVVREAIKWLKGKILFGLTPELAVDWILQNGNDPQYQPILATAVNGTVDNFIAMDAEIGNEPYKTWFTNAIQLIKDAYAEQPTDTDMDGGTGNTPNNAANEKSGAAKSKLKKVG